MTLLVTDLGNTRQSARKLSFSPVSGNTHTNVQDAIEAVSSGGTSAGQRTVTAAGTVTILTTDATVLFNKTDSAVVNLPASAAWLAVWGVKGIPLFLKDISGALETNALTLTVTPNGAETIDGLATVPINTNYGGFNLFPVSGDGWTLK